jgi:hypothetical protein
VYVEFGSVRGQTHGEGRQLCLKRMMLIKINLKEPNQPVIVVMDILLLEFMTIIVLSGRDKRFYE